MYENEFLKSVLALILGSCLGSFSGLLITRLPKSESLLGRSRCAGCNVKISPKWNIPLISFFMTRGKCNLCGSKISRIYPFSEFWLSFSFLIVVLANINWYMKITWFCFLTIGLVQSGIDLKIQKIPNSTNIILFSTIGVVLLLNSTQNDLFKDLIRGMLSSLIMVLIFILIHFLSKGGMGIGDIKLSASIGLLLGFYGWLELYIGFITSFTLGGIISIFAIYFRILNRKSKVPFGPFLYLGTLISILISPVFRNLLY